MGELITTKHNDDGAVIVSGRELHEFLELNERYSKWFGRMIGYGFVENTDFTTVTISTLVNNGARRELEDHDMSLDMAKELSMIQRTDKGKQARLYFLHLEKMWNSPEMIMKRAMGYLNTKLENMQTKNLALTQTVTKLKPKATYYDLVLQNKSLLAISKIAKEFGITAAALNKWLHEGGVQYKQGNCWLLYQKYADKGYTQSKTHVIDAENGYPHTYWTQKGRLFIHNLLKEEGIVPVIEREVEAI